MLDVVSLLVSALDGLIQILPDLLQHLLRLVFRQLEHLQRNVVCMSSARCGMGLSRPTQLASCPNHKRHCGVGMVVSTKEFCTNGIGQTMQAFKPAFYRLHEAALSRPCLLTCPNCFAQCLPTKTTGSVGMSNSMANLHNTNNLAKQLEQGLAHLPA